MKLRVGITKSANFAPARTCLDSRLTIVVAGRNVAELCSIDLVGSARGGGDGRKAGRPGRRRS